MLLFGLPIAECRRSISKMKTDLGPIDERLKETARQQAMGTTALLSNIEDALERLETGTFGYCESCGAPIRLARLLDNPATRLCSSCDKQ